jgi:hypothetical protein
MGGAGKGAQKFRFRTLVEEVGKNNFIFSALEPK